MLAGIPIPEKVTRALKIDRPQANSKRTGGLFSTGPSLPKQSSSCTLALSFLGIAHPNKLDHGVGKAETTISRTLPQVPVWRSLTQSELYKPIRFGCAHSSADE